MVKLDGTPLGLPPIAVGLIVGAVWGITAKMRGRWR